MHVPVPISQVLHVPWSYTWSYLFLGPISMVLNMFLGIHVYKHVPRPIISPLPVPVPIFQVLNSTCSWVWVENPLGQNSFPGEYLRTEIGRVPSVSSALGSRFSISMRSLAWQLSRSCWLNSSMFLQFSYKIMGQNFLIFNLFIQRSFLNFPWWLNLRSRTQAPLSFIYIQIRCFILS